jgi:hypothetical protein
MGRGGYNGGSTVIHAGSGWFGRGSVTSQPSEKKKHPSSPAKPHRKRKKAKRNAPPSSSKGSGLTIPEMVAKAENKVRSISNEIASTKRRLAVLERDLESAKAHAKAVRNTPRRTALGAALLEAEKAKSAGALESGRNGEDAQ